MKTVFIVSLALLFSFTQNSVASTPMETLHKAVDSLIAIAGDKADDDQTKKQRLATILIQEVDFEAVSRRVVSKTWRKASDDEKQQFKKQFLKIMVDTYYALLRDYSNEEVLYTKEQLKKTKYAIVDTQIISGNKKIPVRYRMIKNSDGWKIYDFIPEGISIVSTYKNNYSSILKKKGMQGLLADMVKLKTDKAKE